MPIANIPLSILNPSNKKPEIYIGEQSILEITLTNDTGGDITLSSGSSPSTMVVYLPEFFDSSEVAKMKTSLTDWCFKYNAGSAALTLTYTGPDKASWTQHDQINFQITDVLSNSSATAGTLQINFTNMEGNVPLQTQTPLALSKAPQPGNASLSKVLQTSLDSQGSVFVSEREGQQSDPLQNSLFLNIKNTGAQPIYSGKNIWSGKPRITVTFIYGKTSGALAPDDDRSSPVKGSAWNIKAKVVINQTGGWNVTNPSTTGASPHPTWVLEPSNTNKEIIGSGANANVTFSFDHIISFTPPGHTQMLIQLSGFAKDESTPYDDQIFVIDIVKLTPPATRGLVNFFSETPLIQITDTSTPINIPLRWAMFDVASVNLITSEAGIDAKTISYPNPLPLAYDHHSITIPSAKESKAIFCTLQSFNGLGGLLNSQQFTVFLQSNFFVDSRDGRAYPAILLDGKLWMAENLDHQDTTGAFENTDPSFGYLYTSNSDSVKNPPDPNWRIPSQADWQSLFKSADYTALMTEGSSGFEATLSGYLDNNHNMQSLQKQGFYRSSTGELYASFSQKSKSTSVIGTFPYDYALAIRYVRDV